MDINFEIPNEAIIHLKEESHYDDNYYKIDKSKLNSEWFYCDVCDIIHEEYDEFPDRYTLSFGYFFDNNVGRTTYVPMITFDSKWGIEELMKGVD